MLQRIKKLLEHNALILAIIVTAMIAILSLGHMPKIDLGLHIKSSDKYLHTFAYFVLGTVWFFALKDKLNNRKLKILLITGLTLYGIILEVFQKELTDYRTADFYDAIANFIGIILASILFNKLLNWYNSI